MRPFSLLVKPASADCNLRCPYCFYLDKSALYPDERVHRMSDDVLERLIAGYMATEQPQYAFGWQGGEPTLMGVDFFRRVVELQQKHGRPGSVVANGLQTNATLITDELAELLAEYKFLVGVSLDGPPEVHDTHRRNADGAGSHEKVLQGVECLRRHGVEFNVLILVNSANVRQPGEIYRYLRDQGFLHHQYIPCVEFDNAGSRMPYAITSPEWGDFLCGVFDEWAKSDVRRISIRLFDAILMFLVNGTRIICHMGRNCCQYFVVEYNGDVYPCDFFVEQNKHLGSASADSWESLQHSAEYTSFGKQKEAWDDKCRCCEYLRLCMGDCLKHRADGVSWLCEGWKQFFRHSLPTFETLAREVKDANSRQAASVPTAEIGRNDPCPCGSGRKFKKCHGR